MSDNILTMIETRSKCDLWIFFGLCIFTLFSIYVLYFYIKPAMTLSNLVSLGSSSVPEDAVSEDVPGGIPTMLGETNMDFEIEN